MTTKLIKQSSQVVSENVGFFEKARKGVSTKILQLLRILYSLRLARTPSYKRHTAAIILLLLKILDLCSLGSF